MEIRKIFYTLECVWVHMKIWSNWKSISVDRKLNPLDSEFGLHSNFTFNQFPLSSLTHTKPKERERESLCHCQSTFTVASVDPSLPPFIDPPLLLPPLADLPFPPLFSLPSLPLLVFSLSLSSRTTHWGRILNCMSSIYNSPPTHVVVAHPRYRHLNNLVDLFGFIFLAFFFFANNIWSWGWWINSWDGFFQVMWWVCCGFQQWLGWVFSRCMMGLLWVSMVDQWWVCWLWLFQVNWLCGGWWWLIMAGFIVAGGGWVYGGDCGS